MARRMGEGEQLDEGIRMQLRAEAQIAEQAMHRWEVTKGVQDAAYRAGPHDLGFRHSTLGITSASHAYAIYKCHI